LFLSLPLPFLLLPFAVPVVIARKYEVFSWQSTAVAVVFFVVTANPLGCGSLWNNQSVYLFCRLSLPLSFLLLPLPFPPSLREILKKFRGNPVVAVNVVRL
jgi:hypothetical protein